LAGRVLLVAASPELTGDVEKATEGTGITVYSAQDQLEAILFLDRESCDVVLLSVQGRGPEELAVCRVVRRSWDVGIMLLLQPSAKLDAVLPDGC